MKRSESISNLSKALATFHSHVGKISKDAKNPFFKSNYASLPHILTEIQEPLEKSGLIITQFPDESGLTTMLIHAESGEYLEATYQMPVAKANDPQALGSAISYARRYAVSSILSLKIDDDDAESAMKAVRNPQPEDNRPWLNKGEALDKAMEYLRGGGKMATIEAKYRLSKEIKESLNKIEQSK
jgi:hypothetical protein